MPGIRQPRAWRRKASLYWEIPVGESFAKLNYFVRTETLTAFSHETSTRGADHRLRAWPIFSALEVWYLECPEAHEDSEQDYEVCAASRERQGYRDSSSLAYQYHAS